MHPHLSQVCLYKLPTTRHLQPYLSQVCLYKLPTTQVTCSLTCHRCASTSYPQHVTCSLTCHRCASTSYLQHRSPAASPVRCPSTSYLQHRSPAASPVVGLPLLLQQSGGTQELPVHEGDLQLGAPVVQVAVLRLVALAEGGSRHQLQTGPHPLHVPQVKAGHGSVDRSTPWSYRCAQQHQQQQRLPPHWGRLQAPAPDWPSPPPHPPGDIVEIYATWYSGDLWYLI